MSKKTMKIKKGDRVVVLAGKDKGAEGVVAHAIPEKGKVIVEGVMKKFKKNRVRRTRRAACVPHACRMRPREACREHASQAGIC